MNMEEPLKKKKKTDICNKSLFLDVFSTKDIFDNLIGVLTNDNFGKTKLRKESFISKENDKNKRYYVYSPANILLILFGYSEIKSNNLNYNNIINLKIIHCKYLCYNDEKSSLKFPFYREYIYFMNRLINYGIFKNHELIARKNYTIISYTDKIKNEKDINEKQKLIDYKEKLIISQKNNDFKKAFIKKIFISFANTMNVKSNRGPCSDYDIKHFMNKYFKYFLRIEKNNSEFWNELNLTIFKINVSYIYHCPSITLTNKEDIMRFINKHRPEYNQLLNMYGHFDFNKIPKNFYRDIDISSKLFFLNISYDRAYNIVVNEQKYHINIFHVTSYCKKCIELKIFHTVLSFIQRGTDWIGTLLKFIKNGSTYIQIVFTKKDNIIFDKDDVKIIDSELLTKYIPEELYGNLKEYHRLYPKYCNANIIK